MAETAAQPAANGGTGAALEPSLSAELPEGESLVARVVIADVHGVARTRIVLGSDGASSLSSVFTLCNSCIGAGVLSLPYAFRRAGEHQSYQS